MKKIIFLFLAFCANSTIQAQQNSIDKNNLSVQSIFDDLFIDDKEYLFRGADFNISKAEVEKIESSRTTTSIEDVDNTLIITSDLGADFFDFAYITYFFDGEGLYQIKAEVYITDKEAAEQVYKKIMSNLSQKHGLGKIMENEYYDINVKGENYNYRIILEGIVSTDMSNSFNLYFYIN